MATLLLRLQVHSRQCRSHLQPPVICTHHLQPPVICTHHLQRRHLVGVPTEEKFGHNEEVLRTTAKSLYKIGHMRLADMKTATNVYEHFSEPTVLQLPSQEEQESSEPFKDFLEIHEVSLNFGSPETADQMSGAMYMRSIAEDKCSQCLRLGSAVAGFTLCELTHCLTLMNWWSSQASQSASLLGLTSQLEAACSSHLSLSHPAPAPALTTLLRLAFLWRSLQFQYDENFTRQLVTSQAAAMPQSPLPVLVSCLLLLSSLPAPAPALPGPALAARLQPGLSLLTQPELVACYAGLKELGVGAGLAAHLLSKHGYRI